MIKSALGHVKEKFFKKSKQYQVILWLNDVPQSRFTLIEGFYKKSLKTFGWAKIK